MFGNLKYILILIIIIALIGIFGKYRPVRIVTGLCLLFALMFTAIISYGHINNYYSASGGIYGELTNLLKQNEVTKEELNEDITFSFNNVVLTNKDGYFSLTFNKNESISLEENEKYIIYVNDFPCEILSEDITDNNSYIIARYNYSFYDRDLDGNLILKAEDTMQLELDFYKNSCRLKVFIYNGEETNSLWNTYFSRNDFTVKVSKIDGLYTNDSDYNSLTLYIENRVYKTIKVKSGTEITLPILSDENFICFVDKNGNEYNDRFTLSCDLSLYAKFEVIEDEVIEDDVTEDDLSKSEVMV